VDGSSSCARSLKCTPAWTSFTKLRVCAPNGNSHPMTTLQPSVRFGDRECAGNDRLKCVGAILYSSRTSSNRVRFLAHLCCQQGGSLRSPRSNTTETPRSAAKAKIPSHAAGGRTVQQEIHGEEKCHQPAAT
jgi:hypothetical protein